MADIQLGNNAHIHHPDIGSHLAADGINPRTAGQKGLNHGGGNLLGIGADALGYHPVIPGHYQDCLLGYPGFKGLLDTAQPLRDVMQAPQRPGGHQQLGSSLLRFFNPLPVYRLNPVNNIHQLHHFLITFKFLPRKHERIETRKKSKFESKVIENRILKLSCFLFFVLSWFNFKKITQSDPRLKIHLLSEPQTVVK
jgi:hypothetical protein